MAISGLRLLINLGPHVADLKTGYMSPPTMAKDQSYQISAQNPKSWTTFAAKPKLSLSPQKLPFLKAARAKKERPSLDSSKVDNAMQFSTYHKSPDFAPTRLFVAWQYC